MKRCGRGTTSHSWIPNRPGASPLLHGRSIERGTGDGGRGEEQEAHCGVIASNAQAIIPSIELAA
jgi:hypothetical protein